MLCFVLTTPPLMLSVYLQTFEAALFLEEEVVKSFPRQSRSRGGGIATVYKSTFGSNITLKKNFDFTHTSFEVVQASITLQHNTLHFFCLYRPPPNLRNNLTDSMFTEQLPDLLD